MGVIDLRQSKLYANGDTPACPQFATTLKPLLRLAFRTLLLRGEKYGICACDQTAKMVTYLIDFIVIQRRNKSYPRRGG